MSIIQNIRDKAAWIIIGAIAVALIAFIVQDAFQNQSMFQSNQTTLGRVAGKKTLVPLISKNDSSKPKHNIPTRAIQ